MKQIRNTKQRSIVYQTVQRLTGTHPSAEDIYQAVIKNYPHISRGTVYRNLNLLCDLGLIMKVATENGADRFDDITKHHAHFQCKRCQTVYDVSLAPLAYPQRMLEEGFVIENDFVLLNGLCPKCAEKIKEGGIEK